MSTVTNTAPVGQDLLTAVNPKKATVDSVQQDTDKFMTLLVTQLKNQDPMNPLDNAQITSQLAQLSTVTGINKLNTSLDALKDSYQASAALQATSMIGHGVLAPGDSITLKAGKGLMGVDLASTADDVKVVIQDHSGHDIRTLDLGPQAVGTVPLGWDGRSDDGTLLADGNYRFKVVATSGTDTLKDATALGYGEVMSVSTNARDGVKLNTLSLGVISMGDVKQVL
ncbi:MAG: flagellar hook assembly protein FlgD [Pseudomonadota bacterium]